MVCTQLLGATYYISTTGADGNPGTSGSPWATFAHAAATVAAGDTVLVQPGIYDQYWEVPINGTPASRITFKANGAVTNKSGCLVRHSNLTIDGFQSDLSGTNVNVNRGYFWVYGPCSNVWIINNNLHNSAYNGPGNSMGLYFEISTGLDPTNAPKNCIISNNVFNDLRSGMCIMMNGMTNEIVHNVFANTYSHDGMDVYGVYHWIHDNVFTNVAEVVGTSDHPDIIQVQGNGGVYGAHILFERNLCINCPCQVFQSEQDGTTNVTDWTFQNNVFINIGRGASVGLTGCKWYNNTFYHCFTNGTGLLYSWYNTNNPTYKAQSYGGAISNNAFIGCGTGAGNGWYAQVSDVDNGYYPSNVIPPMDLLGNNDYNFVCNTNFTAKTTCAVYPSTNQFQWNEPHGVNGGDPKIASIETANFYLLTNSPLINAGATTQVTNDFLGVIRPIGAAYDIGAYEYDPALMLWFTYDTDMSTGMVSDVTGNGHDGWRFVATNFVAATNGVMTTRGGLWHTNTTLIEPPSTVIPVSQYIGITNLTGIEYLTNATISFWLAFGPGNDHQSFVLDNGYPAQYGGNTNATTNSWSVTHDGFGYLNFGVYDLNPPTSDRDVVRWPNDESAGTYHHYALTVAGGGNAIAYYDGTNYQSAALGLPWIRIWGSATEKWLAVGRLVHAMPPDPPYTNSGSYAAGFFDGKMDNLRIYNRALSADEILSSFKAENQLLALPDLTSQNRSTPATFSAGTIRAGRVGKP